MPSERHYLTPAQHDKAFAICVRWFLPDQIALLFERMGFGATDYVVVPDGDPRVGTVETVDASQV